MSKYLIPKLSRATEDCDIKFTINERIFEQIVRKKKWFESLLWYNEPFRRATWKTYNWNSWRRKMTVFKNKRANIHFIQSWHTHTKSAKVFWPLVFRSKQWSLTFSDCKLKNKKSTRTHKWLKKVFFFYYNKWLNIV